MNRRAKGEGSLTRRVDMIPLYSEIEILECPLCGLRGSAFEMQRYHPEEHGLGETPEQGRGDE